MNERNLKDDNMKNEEKREIPTEVISVRCEECGKVFVIPATIDCDERICEDCKRILMRSD